LLLIFHTKNQDYDLQTQKTADLFSNVFGNKPTKKNLKKFFENEVIRELWWGQNGFYHSEHLKKILSEIKGIEREELIRYMRKATPSE